MKPLFHYSKAIHLSKICSDGAIIQATAGVPIRETPAVWCSFHPNFEPTAGAGVQEGMQSRTMTVEELAAVPFLIPVRIEVTRVSCPYDWRAFKKLSGIRPRHAKLLEKSAREIASNPADWRVSFVPIPSTAWLSIGILKNKIWLSFPATPSNIHAMGVLSEDTLEDATIEMAAQSVHFRSELIQR